MSELKKSMYRASFNIMKRYIKLSVCAKEIGLSSSSLSRFMKSSSFDYMISEDRLHELYLYVQQCIKNVT